MAKKMIWTTALPVLTGLICFSVSRMAESSIDASGVLHEPFFFLIPFGWMFIFIGLMAATMTACSSLFNVVRARRNIQQ